MRIRITFAKTGTLRYTGHLDLQQVWERTARRAGLPLAYTQGFHPGPKIQIASALPLGFNGRREVVDLWLEDAQGVIAGSCPMYRERLQAAAPLGLTLLDVEEVEERSPALQTQVVAAEYDVELLEGGTPSEVEQKVAQVLAAGSLPRERRGKPYDLRLLILSLECRDTSLRMTLSAREGATGRPEEVLRSMGIPVESARIERTRLVMMEEQDSKKAVK
jgi:radical SAM-linked protein